MRFIDVLISFPDAIPCGVKVASRNNKILLNPDDDYKLADGDEVLVIADDDDSYAPSTSSLPEVQKPAGRPTAPSPPAQHVKSVKKVLFCGWQRGMEDMVPELERTLGSGSELWILSEVPQEKRLKMAMEFENVSVIHCAGKPTVKKDLEALPVETFDSILLVADGKSPLDSDEQQPLSTLIMIKSIQVPSYGPTSININVNVNSEVIVGSSSLVTSVVLVHHNEFMIIVVHHCRVGIAQGDSNI